MTVSCITQQDVYVNILQSLFLHWTIYTVSQKKGPDFWLKFCLIYWAASKLPRLLDTLLKFALFSVCDLKEEKLIKNQTYMKTETCRLYSRDFWIFLPNIIKIDPYNFELYRFKVGPFFETQCSCHVMVISEFWFWFWLLSDIWHSDFSYRKKYAGSQNVTRSNVR